METFFKSISQAISPSPSSQFSQKNISQQDNLSELVSNSVIQDISRNSKDANSNTARNGLVSFLQSFRMNSEDSEAKGKFSKQSELPYRHSLIEESQISGIRKKHYKKQKTQDSPSEDSKTSAFSSFLALLKVSKGPLKSTKSSVFNESEKHSLRKSVGGGTDLYESDSEESNQTWTATNFKLLDRACNETHPAIYTPKTDFFHLSRLKKFSNGILVTFIQIITDIEV